MLFSQPLDPQTETDINFVVRELSSQVRRDEIKQHMMARRGISWDEAEEFVAFVERTYRQDIALRQTPLLLVLAFASIIGGVGLVLYAIWRLRSGIPLTPRGHSRLVGSLGAGVFLIISGIVGLIQTVAALRA